MPYVTNPSSIDPMEVVKNLSQASYCGRTKLFLFVLLVFSIVLLQPILICLNIDLSSTGSFLTNPKWPWILILIPVWTFDAMVYIYFAYKIKGLLRKARVRVAPDDGDVVDEVYSMLRRFLRMLFKFVLIHLTLIFIALKLDNTIQWSYSIIFIPLYMHELAQLLISSTALFRAQKDIGKMITIQTLERDLLKENQTYADLTPEEKVEINETYIIVHAPILFEDDEEEDSETDDDDNGIMRSPEYKIARMIFQQASKRIVLFFFHAVFLVLMVLKLDSVNALDWSWWLVFLPIWIFACCSCCGILLSTREELAKALGHDTPLPVEKNETDGEEKKETDGEEGEGNYSREELVRAACRIFNIIWFITLICLFIGKLEGGDYSSFWIIFPVLLPAGTILCCLFCFIYCFTIDTDEVENIEEADIESMYGSKREVLVQPEDLGRPLLPK